MHFNISVNAWLSAFTVQTKAQAEECQESRPRLCKCFPQPKLGTSLLPAHVISVFGVVFEGYLASMSVMKCSQMYNM